ncbi:MAG: hypothetical protein AB7F99_09175, partial [Vicinamibacterales bacterium]
MLRTALLLVLICYLPGALIFRLPWGAQPRRAAQPPEERLFWAVMLTLIVSGLATLMLALAGAYRFERLLWACGGVSLLVALIGRSGLR